MGGDFDFSFFMLSFRGCCGGFELLLLDFSLIGGAADDDSDHLSFFSLPTPMDRERLSMGKGNTMVELCSVEMAFSVWR